MICTIRSMKPVLALWCVMIMACKEKIPDGYATQDAPTYSAVDPAEAPAASEPRQEPAPCDSIQSCLTLAERARTSGKLEQALPFAHHACRIDRRTCVYEAGVLIELGRSEPARQLIGELCEEGISNEQFSVCASAASAYLQFEPRDVSRSERLATLGCERGDVESCFTLAVSLDYKWYEHADGRAKAFALYERMCREHEHVSSCQNLGVMHASPGEFEDPQEAVRLYTWTCSQGLVRACVDMGARHYTGRDVPVNRAKGLELLEKACAHEDGAGYGCAIYADYLYEQAGGDRALLEKAFTSFERSCSAKSARGCYWGAKRGVETPSMMSAEVRQERYEAARRLARIECEQAHRGKMCQLLSNLLVWEDAGFMDASESARYHELACRYDVRTCEADELP